MRKTCSPKAHLFIFEEARIPLFDDFCRGKKARVPQSETRMPQYTSSRDDESHASRFFCPLCLDA
jgi:hypothetical protein